MQLIKASMGKIEVAHTRKHQYLLRESQQRIAASDKQVIWRHQKCKRKVIEIETVVKGMLF
jgi:hypothetical protein